MKTRNRRTLLKSFGAAAVMSGTGVLGLVADALANGDNPVATGLRSIKGHVLINGKPTRIGMLVKPGDTITTGNDSEAIYVIGNNAFLQRDNSSIVFGDAASDFLRIVTGKLLSVFGKGNKRLVTSTATIGIRGTGCYIESSGRSTYFCLCFGEAEVIPTAAPQQREVIVTKHHEHPITISGEADKPSMMAPAKVINHTDAEVILLENLVGRRPPFNANGSYS